MKMICPLCKSEMYLYERTCTKEREEFSQNFARNSYVTKIEIKSKFYFKCDCSAKIEFDNINYDVAIKYSERDKGVNERTAMYFHKPISEIHKKDTEYFRKKLIG